VQRLSITAIRERMSVFRSFNAPRCYVGLHRRGLVKNYIKQFLYDECSIVHQLGDFLIVMFADVQRDISVRGRLGTARKSAILLYG
jgi:hypothetical protein